MNETTNRTSAYCACPCGLVNVELLNLKIATHLGWEFIDKEMMMYTPDGFSVRPYRIGMFNKQPFVRFLPNFSQELDQCVRFECDAPLEYWKILSLVTQANDCIDAVVSYDDPITDILIGYKRIGLATALQRCEAFARLHGFWNDCIPVK